MRELIVDSFAGGGGASLGISQALGRCPDVAINHDAAAIAMHAANHPDTVHLTEDVWKADPRSVTRGRPVGLLWSSPDCKHHSRAKGGKPVNRHIRSLAWVVVKWAAEVQPRIIMLENVREFEDWGPLLPQWACTACQWRGTEGQSTLFRTRRRCPACDSLKLRETDLQIPDPAKKGLTFKNFVGRLKGLGYAVEWRNLDAADYGAPTHRRRLFLVARRDGERINWPEPTHAAPDKCGQQSLFGPKLQPWRTAASCIDWSIPCPSIFERKKPLAEKTLKRIALGIKRYVLESAKPFIVELGHGEGKDGPNGRRPKGIDQPLGTITSGGENFALISPYVVGCGGRAGQSPDRSAWLVHRPGFGREFGPANADQDGRDKAPVFGGQVGVGVDTPLPTTTVRGTQNQIVAANLIHLNHGDKQWNAANEPLRTVTTGNHAALVYSFLTKYFGTAIGANLLDPAPTSTGKDRFGLVTVTVDGEPYVIVDIGMRMLTPRELARAQGFPDSFILTGTRTSQVARIGNSVAPVMAKALVEANFARQPAEVA